jgi:hypothetical protein
MTVPSGLVMPMAALTAGGQEAAVVSATWFAGVEGVGLGAQASYLPPHPSRTHARTGTGGIPSRSPRHTVFDKLGTGGTRDSPFDGLRASGPTNNPG